MKIKFILLSVLFSSLVSLAQEPAPAPLTAEERKLVVDSIGTILNRLYVFPDVGKKIQSHLNEKYGNGAYNDISNPIEFADILTQDVQSINNDRHMRVRFSPDIIEDMRQMTLSEADSLRIEQEQLLRNRRGNYGFQEVRILEGNIGYLDLHGFSRVTEEAGQTAQAAMNFLSNADALIIDLRQNGGGSPAMIQLITSYLYGPERVHLNNFYSRATDETTQTWTLPYVPGKRRPDIDVYVLTSGRTFSAAEEFTYNLRNLQRATIIGETTGGGAHPGGTEIATDRFTIWVPDSRAINPISKTNWEGTGVEPHIKVPAAEALEEAKIQALTALIKHAKEDDWFSYEWALTALKTHQDTPKINVDILKSYAGTYGPRMIKYEDGNLFYQREGNPSYRLIPMSEELFRIEELSYFRLKIIKEDGRVVGLQGLYNDGRTDENARGQ